MKIEQLQDITLIHGDCMDYLRTLPDKAFDLAIVDPPYGGNDAIGLKDNANLNRQSAKRTKYKLFKNKEPEQLYFDELKRVSKNQIIWGVNFYTASGLNGGRIVWDKKGTAFGRAEEAYYSNSKSVEIFEFAWNGMIQQNMKDKENRIHPTQKPVQLYKWLLKNYANEGDTILDTHLGSGSSAIAAHDGHYKFTGIELDADYYEAAKKRIEYHQRQTSLF